MNDTASSGAFSDRAALAKLIENLSDEDLYKFAGTVGMPNVLEMVIAALTSRFRADAAAGQDAVVQWDVVDADGAKHSFVLTVADGAMTGEIGAAAAPRMTMVTAVPVFLKFLAGTIDPVQAFMGGDLAVDGDMAFALTFQTWISTD